MDLKQISKYYNIPYWKVSKLKKSLKIGEYRKNLSYEEINLIVNEYAKEFKISLETKILIFEYKEKWPMLTAEDIAYSFCLDVKEVKKIFAEEFLIVPSKLNSRKLISLSNG